jgi:hypothetical protein
MRRYVMAAVAAGLVASAVLAPANAQEDVSSDVELRTTTTEAAAPDFCFETLQTSTEPVPSQPKDEPGWNLFWGTFIYSNNVISETYDLKLTAEELEACAGQDFDTHNIAMWNHEPRNPDFVPNDSGEGWTCPEILLKGKCWLWAGSTDGDIPFGYRSVMSFREQAPQRCGVDVDSVNEADGTFAYAITPGWTNRFTGWYDYYNEEPGPAHCWLEVKTKFPDEFGSHTLITDVARANALTPDDVESRQLAITINIEEESVDPGEPGPVVIDYSNNDFGDVDVFTAKTQWVKVTNTSGYDIPVNAIELPYDKSGQWLKGDDKGCRNVIIDDATCEVEVQFFPRFVGSQAAVLDFDLGVDYKLAIPLIGVGVDPGELTVTPSAVDFDDVPAGESKNEKVAVESTFANRVVVESKLKTKDKSYFGWAMCSVTAGTVALFDKSGKCTGVASFRAPKGAEPGEYAVKTVVTPHVNEGPIDAPVKGAKLSGGLKFTTSAFVPAGMNAGPVLSADMNPVSFGTVAVGDVKEKSLKITNVGDEALDIDRIKVVDSDDEFDVVDTGPCLKGKIDPDESCRMTVRFFPREDGPAAGVLQIKSNSERGTDQIGLNGNGELVIVPDDDGDLVPPGKVRNLKAASKSLSCRAATVSWQEPKDSGSAPVTSYDVRIKKDGEWKKWKSTDWVPNANNKITKRYKKLTPKTTYKVQVRAVSAVGAGEKKTVKFTTPRCGVPTKPGNG